jgi:hypothetical protein
MPNRNRFWVHAENCYTEEELRFREMVINTRANSGIDPDYLNNPSSWFAANDQALTNPNEHSWFYSNAYRPRQVLTRADFHVQPVDGQRLQWPSIYNLMRQVGNYLLRRNEGMSDEHLNQPMNYVLLDINFMLKGLSQNPNIGQVQAQLGKVKAYVRTIESNTSPLIGSDRLFCSEVRDVIDEEIHPQLHRVQESQLLQEHLKQLSKAVRQVSSERNLILHFALHKNRVLPHPYEFAIEPPDDLASNPVQAARVCGQPTLAIAATNPTPSLGLQPATELSLDEPTLRDCPHFSLITNDHEIRAYYAQAVSDLDNLERFQVIISEVVNLLGQAGEVYTVHQFRQQMLTLLRQLNNFLDSSSLPIERLIKENTRSYHKAIQDQQDLSHWKRMFTTEEESLQTYIDNQDTLARFPSGIPELASSRRQAQENTNTIIGRLNQPQNPEHSINTIMSQVQELNSLLSTMDHWINYQHRGLKAVVTPPRLSISNTPTEIAFPQTGIHANPTSTTSISTPPDTTVHEEPAPTRIYTQQEMRPSSFFPAASAPQKDICFPSDLECQDHCPAGRSYAGTLVIGAALALPALFLLYLFLRSNKEDASPAPDANLSNGEKRQKLFKRKMTQVETLIAQIRGYEASTDSNLSDDYFIYLDDYKQLKKEASAGQYNLAKLNDNYKDFLYFYDEICVDRVTP